MRRSRRQYAFSAMYGLLASLFLIAAATAASPSSNISASSFGIDSGDDAADGAANSASSSLHQQRHSLHDSDALADRRRHSPTELEPEPAHAIFNSSGAHNNPLQRTTTVASDAHLDSGRSNNGGRCRGGAAVATLRRNSLKTYMKSTLRSRKVAKNLCRPKLFSDQPISID